MRSRAYAGPDDLQRMLDCLMAWRHADTNGEYEHVGDLLWAFRRQSEPEHNAHLWEERGRIAGFVIIDPDWGALLCQNHPEAAENPRHTLFDWGMERLRQIRHEEGQPTNVMAQAREDNTAKIVFLEAEGFIRTDSPSVELLRPLNHSIPSPSLPEGFTIRSLAGEYEAAAYVDMHRDAWSVWAPSTYSVQQHLRLMRDPGYTTELNPVVVAPDGRLAASCIGWLDPVNKIGEIEPLGVRPANARRGLGRAVVLEVLRRMHDHGMETALVYGTHVNQPAWNLYQSLGFKAGRTIYTYQRKL